MALKKQAETYGVHDQWMLTKDKLYVMVEDKDGNTKPQFVSKYIKISNVRQVSETKEVILILQYLYRGEYQTIEIKREQLHPNEFQKLNGSGVDVIYSNVRPLIQFLRVQEESAPYDRLHNHMGWEEREGQLSFKHHSLIGENHSPSTYCGEYDIEPKGTLQGWLDIIKSEVIGNTNLELALTFGFSAPVVGLLSKAKDMDTLIVHLFGNSTKGKTSAARVAVSPFGNPSNQNRTTDSYDKAEKKGLIRSWSATHNAIVALFRNNYGVPIVLDEASMNTMKDFTSLIYMFAENREKERMTKEGKLKKQSSWSTTIISTAEHSLFEKTNENVGIRMRAFEFGNMAWTSSAENSNNLKKGLLENYGHAGIKFIKYLLKLGVSGVVNRCDQWKKYCEKNLPQTEFISRVSEKFGILLATAEMINESLNLSLNIESLMKVLYAVEEESSMERDMADKSYEYIVERVMQHSKYFIMHSRTFTGNECWGKMNLRDNEVEVSIFPNKFKQLLKEGNYSDPKVICKEWKEKGYLKTENGKYTNRGKIPIDSQVRTNSGLITNSDSKGRDKVFTVMINEELSEKYSIRKTILEEEESWIKRKQW